MLFTVVRSGGVQSTQLPRAFLYPANWDDWFAYETKFVLVVWDEKGAIHQPGSVKIGQRGLRPRRAELPPLAGHRVPAVPTEFDFLSDDFFSLGQSENFYEIIGGFNQPLRDAIFHGLGDVAADLGRFEQARQEGVMTTSLLREVTVETVRGRYHRLAVGDTRLTEYYFQYMMPKRAQLEPPNNLDFHVRPRSSPPTNVHALIGRNGVGKTRLMRGVAQALIGRPPSDAIGSADIIGAETETASFAGLVLVSFSAFDDFDLAPSREDRISAVQVGLPPWTGAMADAEGETSFLGLSANAFADSLELCRTGPRAERWLKAVRTLETDELFAQANAEGLLGWDDASWREQTTKWFKRLSSGHAIVLLTITRLVELVDERTLVLLDEPEAHLHPPLLSAFVRALSDLLVNRNGVAIVATHSPVVLQEVPRSCTWVLRRTGANSHVERPAEETFGQNVATLTREVFGLEINKSGFHKLVADVAGTPGITYEAVLERFEHQLGAEGRALARALIAERDASRTFG